MDAKTYNQRLAQRLETLLNQVQPRPPLEAMDEIAEAAEAGGLVDNSNSPRRSAPHLFASDLLIENPVALDWMNGRLEMMPDPLEISELEQIASRLK